MNNLVINSEVLEQMVCSYSLHNASFFLKVKPYLTTSSYKKKSYFNDNKNQLIFNILSRWYDKYKSFPHRKEMDLFIEKLDEDEDIKLLVTSMVDKYYKEDTSEYSEQHLIDETQKFIQETRVIEAIAISQVDMENGTYSNIVENLREAVNVNFDKDLGISIKDADAVKEKIEGSLTNINKISFGFPAFDRIFGGLFPAEMFCFSSIPGLGKTLTMGNVAINAFNQGKNVLVYSMETGSARLLTRYYTNMLSTTKAKIIEDTPAFIEKVRKEISTREGDIILKEYGANMVSSNDLLAHINDLKMYKGWVPDLIIIDYLLIMLTNDKRQSSSDGSYKYYKTVSEEVRNIAKFCNVPVVTACQINREGMDDKGGSKALTTAKDIGESRGILDTVDYFVTINQTEIDKKNNKIMFYVSKNRNDLTGVKIHCDVDYATMRITERAN